MMNLIFVTIGLLAVAFAGLTLKLWGTKKGKFPGTCASQNPYLNKEGTACGFCGKRSEAQACEKNTPAASSKTRF